MTEPKGGEILVQYAGDWPKATVLAFLVGLVVAIAVVSMLAKRFGSEPE